jgi:hypothetical protein
MLNSGDFFYNGKRGLYFKKAFMKKKQWKRFAKEGAKIVAVLSVSVNGKIGEYDVWGIIKSFVTDEIVVIELTDRSDISIHGVEIILDRRQVHSIVLPLPESDPLYGLCTDTASYIDDIQFPGEHSVVTRGKEVRDKARRNVEF